MSDIIAASMVYLPDRQTKARDDAIAALKAVADAMEPLLDCGNLEVVRLLVEAAALISKAVGRLDNQGYYD